jgi:hypothetical protein
LLAKLKELFDAATPAGRARRKFWKHFVAAFLCFAAFAAFAGVLEDWFNSHKFVLFVCMILLLAAFTTIVVMGHFGVNCPRCGWNINLTKGYGRVYVVPSNCVNCGLDLNSKS